MTVWVPVPDVALPGQYAVGDFVEYQGRAHRIIARSTKMARIRPVRWYEWWSFRQRKKTYPVRPIG